VSESATHRAIHAIVRLEWAKLVAVIARMVRDVGVAEEIAQDALVAALESWPESGIPDNPGAWLTTTAKRRALNHLARDKMLERKHAEFTLDGDARAEPDPGGTIDDDLLRLVFVSCHPVLSREARVALTLRLLGGLTTEEIARAYLSTEATIAQRIVRAKRTLADAKVPFEVPGAAERAERLASVCEVIYLIFNEGWSANAGDDAMRPELIEDALRLGRVLAGLMPAEPEVHGLIALMELHASRAPARTNSDGNPVLLPDQDRTRWDLVLIRRGLAALAKAEQLGGARGPYALQAAISACHARATVAADTDWKKIASLYDLLLQVLPSPVVALNRAMAVAMAEGPAVGLALIDDLAGEPSLADYPWVPSARADLLEKLGRTDEARGEFERAAKLSGNARDRAQLLARVEKLRK
jgi:RNA polymerase sigma factor (sigma-70 family)